MDELISVIIPVYNIENYIEKCVKSVIDQTYSKIEIIIVDDGSKDRSPEICDKIAKEDSRVKVVHQKNQGLSGARNKGIELANGSLVAFVDGDDYIEKDMYETLYNDMKKYNADIAICDFVLNADSIEVGKPNIKIMNSRQAIKELLLDDKLDNFAWNKLFKKKLFDNVRFPIGRKYEDIGTIYLLFENATKIVYSNLRKYHYVERMGAITKSYKENTLADYMYMVDKMLSHMNFYYSEFKEEINTLKVKYAINFHSYCVKGKFKNMYKNDELLKKFYEEFKDISKKDGILRASKKLDVKHRIFAIILFYNRNLAYKIGKIQKS